MFDFDTRSTRKGNPNEARSEIVDSDLEDAAIVEHREQEALLA